MKKMYSQPVAKKIAFEFRSSIVASPATCTIISQRTRENMDTVPPCDDYWIDTFVGARSAACNVSFNN